AAGAGRQLPPAGRDLPPSSRRRGAARRGGAPRPGPPPPRAHPPGLVIPGAPAADRGDVTGYLLRRLAQVIPTALLAATLVFSLIHLIPGDPVEMMLGEGAQPTDVTALRHDLGLDRPLLGQDGRVLPAPRRGRAA